MRLTQNMVGIQIRICTEVIYSFLHWNVLNKQAGYRVSGVSKQHSHGTWGSRYVEQFRDKSGDSGHLCTLLLDQLGESEHLCTLFLEQAGDSEHHCTVLLSVTSVTYLAQDL